MMVMKTRGFTALVCVFLTLLCCRSVDGFQTVRSHNKLLPTFTPPHSHRQGLRIRDTKMHNSNYNYNFNNNNRRNVDDPEFQVLFPTVNEFDLPRILTLSFPAFIFLFAFSTYKETSLAFHNFINAVSGNTWLPADGGKSLTDLITPALNGPVTTVISLLFGTLVSTTIGNLYNRQNELSCLLATMFDDIRLAEIHAEFFPEPYGRRASQLLQDFTISIIEDYDVNQGDFEAEVDKLRDRRELGMLIYLFHEMEADPNVNVPGGALGESYGTVNKIIAARSDLIATYNNCFPPWHYGNLTLLAAAISIIFLVITDKTALQFLGGFQLRLCWSLLLGTFALLAVVIWELNTPLSGIFKTVRSSNINRGTLEAYSQMLQTENNWYE